MKKTNIFFGLMLLMTSIGTANAAILFQDDDFHQIESPFLHVDYDGTGSVNTGISFGNDVVSTENGTITWDITNNEFDFDHDINVTGGITAIDSVDFSGSSQTRLREVANVINGTTSCSNVGELVIDTGDATLYVCTNAGTDSWALSGPADFEGVYSYDADDTLTTSGGNFSIALGAGEFDVTSTGLIDFNADDFDMDLTGIFAVNAVGNSNLTIDSGDLALATTTSGDVSVSAADAVTVTSGAGEDVSIIAGDDLLFDDSQLTGTVQLSDAATDWSPTFSTDGIIDNINSFALTTLGNGASNVGVFDSGSNLENIDSVGAVTDVQDALEKIDAQLGGTSGKNEILSFDPQYPDAVIYQDGSSNNGTMRALYDSTNSNQHYRFTTNRVTQQDMDIRFRFPLPSDFNTVGDFTYEYRTGTVTQADNNVQVTVRNDTDNATCASDTTNSSAATWSTGTLTSASLTAGCASLDPEDVIEVIVKLLDISGGSTFADISTLSWDYSN